jgi:tetratricopeptide (TPR) repeat protein
MPLNWFNVRDAVAAGTALADQFAPQMLSDQGEAMEGLLRRVDSDVRPLRLNLFKRARFANSFKWRLLERGVEQELADHVTQALVLHLATQPAAAVSNRAAPGASLVLGNRVKDLLAQGNGHFARGEYPDALACFEKLAELKPRNADALNNVGATLCRLNRLEEAEDFLRRAIKVRPEYAEAHCNMGAVLEGRGSHPEAEASLRRALKIRPTYIDARCLLGLTLLAQGRLPEATSQLEKALKIAPRHVDALIGMGRISSMQGEFDEADGWFKRALEVNPNSSTAWAALAGVRKMTAIDRPWLERAQQFAAAGLPPSEQAAMHFAIGKYYDDSGDFKHAFESYRNANELIKPLMEGYRPEAHDQFIDDLIKSQTREAVAQASVGASDSRLPVFVVGMARSGTTLVEQIIASHPAAKVASEPGFWSQVGRRYEAEIRQAPLEAPVRQKLAEQYLQALLSGGSDGLLRVVDKDPVNSDYLGVIHAVFPRARFIYMQRDPIDTCLSCYFQQFGGALSHTLDLSDLASYYRQHQRLMRHWRAVLPPETLLEVPYEELVVDPELWTRRILEFVGLEWDQRCLDFHKTRRVVTSASSWQVRQPIFRSSVQRWRNYEKFIGPLLSLR